MSTESYYRSFLKVPYENATMGGRRRRHRKRHYGGHVNRFGATLSGNPNPRFLFGSPTGGDDGIIRPKVMDRYNLGGGRKRHHRKHYGGALMERYLYPNTTYHTYPPIGSMIY